jgi:hypothetical protein
MAPDPAVGDSRVVLVALSYREAAEVESTLAQLLAAPRREPGDLYLRGACKKLAKGIRRSYQDTLKGDG